jgi:hypothetical protein
MSAKKPVGKNTKGKEEGAKGNDELLDRNVLE